MKRMWLSHTQSTMPDKTPQGHPDGFPFHGITFLPFWFSMSPFRFRRSLFQGFPVPCLNIRIPYCDLSHQQESMGLPKFSTYLFLRATACRLRRIFTSLPLTDALVLPSVL